MRWRSSKYALLLVLSVGIFVSLGFSQQALKIGVINSQRVLEDSLEGKRVIAQLKDRDKKIQDELTKADDEIRRLETKLNTQRTTLNEESVIQLTSDIERKRTDRQRRAEDAVRDLRELQGRLFTKVQNELLPIIEQIGKEQNFDLIFDLGKSGAIYFNPTIEVTDEVIKRYDASKSGK